MEESKGPSIWASAFIMESKVADIISAQAAHGCNFKSRNAAWHYHVLTERIVNIDKELIPRLPKMMNIGTSYKKPFKINGQFMKWPGDYAERVGLKREDVAGPFTAVWYTPFDPGKTAKVKEVMFDYGWQPNEWNIKKQEFQVWQYRRRLMKTTYAAFLKEQCKQEEREYFEMIVNGFIQKHFTNKSRMYMREVLRALGFGPKTTPTFGAIKKKLLLSQFWPTSPKIDADKDRWADGDNPIGQLLSDRMQCSHRRSLMAGLLSVTRPDGKISGEANPCATPTARMRHRKIVNIPAGGAYFGNECRNLFVGDYNNDKTRKPEIFYNKIKEGMRVKKNTNVLQEWNDKESIWEDTHDRYRYYLPANQDVFVGGDGAGLELRMLTHYLIWVSEMKLEEAKDSGNAKSIRYYESALRSALDYRETLLEGDIHSHNQRLAGLPTRGQAKGFIYAFLYGAGDPLLGQLVGGGKKEGAEMRATFLAECPCIPVLIDWAQDHARAEGWVPAIDGRRLIMRRDTQTGEVMAHKALNMLLQAAGSIVMKYSMLFLQNWNKRDGLDCHQVIMMHDEFQFTCKLHHLKQLQANIDACVKRAGEHLDMKCSLASDSMVGVSWLDTH